jgi:hypothetical protein
MKKISLLLVLAMTSIGVITAQTPSELWITGSAVPNGPVKMTTRPDGTFFYPGELTAGEVKFIDTETVGTGTHYVLSYPGDPYLDPILLDKSGWTIEAKSTLGGYPKERVIDGDYDIAGDKVWHNDFTTDMFVAQWLVIDMQSPVEISRINALRRQGGGSVVDMEYFVGNDPDPDAGSWTSVGTIVGESSWTDNWSRLDLKTPATGQYLKLLLQPNASSGNVSLCEVDVYKVGTTIITPTFPRKTVLLDKTGWTAMVSDVLGGYPVENVIDGNYDNFWNGATSGFPLPHWIVIDMQNPVEVGKIDTWRRPFSVALAKSIEYYIGDSPDPNATTWTQIASGSSWVDDKNTLDITTPATGRYLKLLMNDSDYAGGVCAIAEIDVYSLDEGYDAFPLPTPTTDKNYVITDDDSAAPGWKILAADTYKVSVNLATESVYGTVFTPWNNLYAVGGATEFGWVVESAIPFVQDAENQNVFVFDGELRIREGNPEPNVFKFIGQNDSFSGKSLHPYSANTPIIGCEYLTTNSLGDNKWTIDETQQGRYIIQVDVLLETISAQFDDGTGLKDFSLDDANDPVIQTLYYNLQGIKVQQPATGGIYIVKKVHKSQKTEVGKILYRR